MEPQYIVIYVDRVLRRFWRIDEAGQWMAETQPSYEHPLELTQKLRFSTDAESE
jgi:hypothetical protein